MATLLTVERKRVDPHRLYGFVVGESDDLMLLQNNVDFKCDGYVVVRKKDITWSGVTDGNGFHMKVMKKEGFIEKVPKTIKKLSLDSWGTLLKPFVGKVVILESEKSDDFYIGEVLEVGPKAVIIDYIDGCAERMGEERILYSKITQMRFGDRYSNIYDKYLKR